MTTFARSVKVKKKNKSSCICVTSVRMIGYTLGGLVEIKINAFLKRK